MIKNLVKHNIKKIIQSNSIYEQDLENYTSSDVSFQWNEQAMISMTKQETITNEGTTTTYAPPFKYLDYLEINELDGDFTPISDANSQVKQVVVNINGKLRGMYQNSAGTKIVQIKGITNQVDTGSFNFNGALLLEGSFTSIRGNFGGAGNTFDLILPNDRKINFTGISFVYGIRNVYVNSNQVSNYQHDSNWTNKISGSIKPISQVAVDWPEIK
jgi:hypothetical protein